ncbi:hypothetical protein A2410_01300 [Candidatus Shapirobacteria bacterium RIFOXYC1_FULL_38_24]|nr:MAG: hypothetical protein A2367_01120 [Candidatus Shapirobacteria bacterium RIFOXYB1_FULL_38_38]OGL57908.1 MAG: hypothetical protein A2410_01300 [Candidatus Shapirobacteria bacterium RIFOXYC1_FULL_38_24]HAP38065.1 hypothetical protein [Candidatus Shapirobacteria bacterium]HCU55306.1 hypothetical protein [Candidatus Shapirobacteria bacterium]
MSFCLILIFNLGVRIYGLDKSPPSVNFDEAALGYNAYSIMKTGRDEYGNYLPLSLRSFNDYKPALYSYLSIPFVYLLGLNEISTRMVSALAGTASLIFLFLFLKEFVTRKKYLLFIFLTMSLQPWRLHFSRTAFESNLSMFLFSGGAWFLYSYLKIKDYKKMIWSVMFFVSAAYSYHSARLAAPLILGLVSIDPIRALYQKIRVKSKILVALIMFIILSVPIFLANSNLVLTRFKQENIFNRYYPYTPRELVTEGNPWLNWKNNPVYYFAALVAGHIMAYVSPINLGSRVFHFVKGSPQSIPSFSMLGWLESMILVAGLVVLIKNIKKEKNRFLVYWLVAGIAPAAVTWNWFHPLRSLNIFPALEVVVGIGMAGLLIWISKWKSKWLAGGVRFIWVVVTILSLIFVINNEYRYAVWENHGEYQPGGFKQGAGVLKNLQEDYDQVIIDSPHAQSYIFFLFYQSFPPEIVQQYASIRPKPGIEGNLNFDFYKFKFRKFDWPKDKELTRTLFWTSSEVKVDEIKNTPGADVIQFENAVKYIGASLIIKQ